ncbi:MAG TPA: T9SS type A sorting domain-containing protein [Candidatus Acidoferrales bacterium]|nr:T9SS type A sorting domain-containing protein [Candidatus Acidoferrales bacterium]
MRNRIFALLGALTISASVHAQGALPIEGKGMWIWQLWNASGGSLGAVINKLRTVGVTWVVIKVGDGDSYYNSADHSLYNWAVPEYGSMDSVASIFHSNGIKIFAFQYVYGVPHYWGNSASETDVANMILSIKGIDGLLIDAEIEYDTLASRVPAAQAYCDSVHSHHPESFVGLTSWARVDGHNTFPWTTFLDRVRVNMPQTYWAARPTTPQNELSLMSGQFASYTQTWVKQGDSAANKPIMPIGQGEYFGYSNNVRPGDISGFCSLSQQAYHYAGVSLWEYGQIDSPFVWNEYTSAWPLTAISQGPAISPGYSLFQNYPDPFNPSTVIDYWLPELTGVTLKVYDVLGREVTTLVNEQENPGKYQVKFDGSRFASGVYFYRLTTSSGVVQVRKMILEK